MADSVETLGVDMRTRAREKQSLPEELQAKRAQFLCPCSCKTFDSEVEEVLSTMAPQTGQKGHGQEKGTRNKEKFG